MASFTPIGVEAVIENERGFTKGLNLMQGAITGFATAAAQAAIQGVKQLGEALIGLGTSSIESSISVESAFAGVIKTTDGLTDDMGNLTQAGAELKAEFRELALSTPVEEVEELMMIGELGGQLGIAREDLIAFTETIAAMGVSTNLTTEDAATQFAQFANVMGTTEREGSAAFSKLGSAIVALGNNFATNEADIANFASRIAGAGAIAGLTESDVLAIGAAMSSVGVQAEAGGTAVQKVLLSMNQAVLTGSEDLEIFAAVAGQSVGDFATMWEQDAGAAFEMFVTGLGTAGDDALIVLEELGLQDQRLIRSFLSLANAGTLLTDTMNESSSAWAENTALTNEAAQRYATTESQIQLAKNQLRDFGITIGDAVVPFIGQALNILQPFITEIGERLPGLLQGSVIPALQAALSWIGEMLPQAIQFVSDLWTGTLQPALADLSAWFSENIPTAIAVVVDFWQTRLLPIFGALQEQWATKVQPALVELQAWFQEQIPGAVSTAAGFWEGTLKPALEAVWAFIIDPLIPTIADVVVWLLENIPVAIQTAAAFWTQTLQPAIMQVYEFIRDQVIPIIASVVDWFMVNVPVAIAFLTDRWENLLLPVLQTVWAFIDEYVLPLLTELAQFISTTLQLAVAGMALLWEKSLKPQLDAVWQVIEEKVLPIFDALRRITKEEVQPILQKFADFLGDTLGRSIQRIIESFRKATEILGRFLDKLREWRNTPTPEDYKPGSPPPLFYALTDIGAAMANLSQVQIPALTAQMSGLGRVTAGSFGGAGVTNNNNITLNATVTGGMSAAAFQARTLRTVEGALAA